MPMNANVFHAILALDSYNRGYGANVNGLSQTAGTRIGTATIVANGEDTNGVAQAAGFYASAYNWNGQNVISYRGTNPNFGSLTDFYNSPGVADIRHGWTLGAGFAGGSQAQLTIALN